MSSIVSPQIMLPQHNDSSVVSESGEGGTEITYQSDNEAEKIDGQPPVDGRRSPRKLIGHKAIYVMYEEIVREKFTLED